MALRMESREFTSSGRGAGTREERSCVADCCLAGSVLGAEDDVCMEETPGKTAIARNARSEGFIVSFVLDWATNFWTMNARGVYIRMAMLPSAEESKQ